MKSFCFWSLLLVSALFIACEAVPEKEAAQDNEDSSARILTSDLYPNCWINEHTLQREAFHSEPFGSKLDSANTDSYGLRAFFKDLGNKKPNHVIVDFWTLCPKSETKPILVVSVDSLDKNKFWVGVELKDSISSTDQWENFHCKVPLPENISMEDRITIYLWNPEKKLLYVDDMTFKFLYR